jgi:hypothetical protein
VVLVGAFMRLAGEASRASWKPFCKEFAPRCDDYYQTGIPAGAALSTGCSEGIRPELDGLSRPTF